MVAIQHLNNAPVVEGLVDFRVRPSDGIQFSSLEPLWEAVKPQYPVRRESKRFQTSIQIKDDTEIQQAVASEIIGYRFEKTDGKSIIQVQLDGFSFSRLAPYDSWDALVSEARTFWAEYRRTVKPARITRVATRFINRIELPFKGEVDFDDYLTVPPSPPDGLAQNLGEFLTRIVVTDPKTGASVVLIQALEPFNPQNNTLPILIDVDVFKIVEMEPDGEDYWKLLASLRELKNQAFFSSITSKTLELIK